MTEPVALIFDAERLALTQCLTEAAKAARVGAEGGGAPDQHCDILALGEAALKEGCQGAIMKLQDRKWAYMAKDPVRKLHGEL